MQNCKHDTGVGSACRAERSINMDDPSACGLFLRIVGGLCACRCLVTRDGAAYGSAPRPERGSIPGIGNKKEARPKPDLSVLQGWRRGGSGFRSAESTRCGASRLASYAGQPLTRMAQLRAPNGVRSPASVTKKRPDRSRTSLFCKGGDEGDRTPDLLTASQALSQLSYAPVRRSTIEEFWSRCNNKFGKF